MEELESLTRTAAEKESAKADEESVESLQTQLENLTKEKVSFESKIASLDAQLTQMGKEVETLSSENEMLWLRVGRGEFDQERQRCLVLSQNPVSHDLSLRKAALEALKGENRALLERVEELSRLASTAATSAPVNAEGGQALVPQSVVDNLRSDLLALQTSIEAKDKAMLRLKQVFSAKANEFREAIQSLFGYKVKFMENGKVKLTSTHNRSSNSTSLIFESEQGNVGKVKLMGEAIKFQAW